MLTKDDLKKMRVVIREEVEAEKDELSSDFKISQMRILNEISSLKDKLKNIEIKLNRIQKDLSTAVNFLDRENLKTTKRLDRVEKHLGFSPASGQI